jgi:hypothetical protein
MHFDHYKFAEPYDVTPCPAMDFCVNQATGEPAHKPAEGTFSRRVHTTPDATRVPVAEHDEPIVVQ